MEVDEETSSCLSVSASRKTEKFVNENATLLYTCTLYYITEVTRLMSVARELLRTQFLNTLNFIGQDNHLLSATAYY